MATFNELGVHHKILRALEQMGFTEATPIQEQIIPHAKEGKDLVGQAQTGTGKTAAFGIPLIEKMDAEEKHAQGLVLTPTRELAIQVAEELNKIAKHSGIHALPIYGGQDIVRQIRELKKRPQIIVATPGRFMDHMRRKTIRLHAIHTVVLDEADEMLSMGFVEDIELILKEIPQPRQTLLFSATMPQRLQSISQQFMVDPVSIKVKAKEMTVSSIEQYYYEVPEKQKFETLCRLLDIHSPELAIIFGRTKRRVDELTEALKQRGFEVEGLHGDMKQGVRDSAIGKFKRGTIDVLVATDVAARGLDISGVTHVFNFDLPQETESYVHRIGRTGRAGKEGVALTFVTPGEMEHLHRIEEVTKRKMERRSIPSFAEANEARYQQAVDQLHEMIKQDEYHELETLAQKMLEDHDPAVIVAAALKMVTKEQNDVTIKLTEEAPLRTKKKKVAGFGGRRSQNKPQRGRGRDKGGRESSNKLEKPPHRSEKFSKRSEQSKQQKQQGTGYMIRKRKKK